MRLSLRQFRRLAVISLVMLFVVVVAGAAVRLTDSGLGCADWPRCSDERFVDVSSRHAAIEQLNRIYSGLVGVMALVVFVASLLLRERRRDLQWWSGIAVAGVLANAVLGGISVRVDLHPLAVQGHLLLALLCVAATTVVVSRAGHGPSTSTATTPAAGRLVFGIGGLTAAAIVAGTVVTGAGPHAGDAEAERLDVAITTVVPIHSGLAIAATVASLSLAWLIRSSAVDRAALANELSTWLFIALMQGAIGYIQYFNDLPELLVGAHVGGATLLTWATTRMLLRTREPSVPPAPHHDERATDVLILD